MFDGKEVFLVSGSNTHSIPTAMFTMANMMKGVVGFTFLPISASGGAAKEPILLIVEQSPTAALLVDVGNISAV